MYEAGVLHVPPLHCVMCYLYDAWQLCCRNWHLRRWIWY